MFTPLEERSSSHGVHFPIRIVERFPMSPKTFNNHIITTITTTTFKTFFMVDCIGMYLFITQKITPTTTKTTTKLINGIVILLSYGALKVRGYVSLKGLRP
jgi:hypothetical protein